MHNMIVKIMCITTVLLLVLSVFPNNALCSWVEDADSFLEASSEKDIGIDKSKLDEASDDIFNMISSIGMIIAFIVGIILGINLMITAADEKAKAKEALIPYVVGCVVMFGAFGIWKIMVNTFSGL